MKQNDKIEAVANRVRVAELLVAAVPLVRRVIENRDPPVGAETGPEAHLERAVAGSIVDHQHFDIEIGSERRNTLEHTGERRLSLVSDDENQNFLLHGTVTTTSLAARLLPQRLITRTRT